MIDRWVRRGRLLRRYRGVYVASPALTAKGAWMAAVLACGPGAKLSHRSAGAAWAMRRSSRAAIDVTAPSGGRGVAGIDAHRCVLHPADVTTLDGLPITTVARTALDLAEVVPQRHVERFLVAAEQQRLFDLHAFLDVLHRHPGRHGQKPLRAALAAYAPEQARSKSEMELVALDLIRAHGLPMPQVNVLVEGFEVDLYWPAQRVAIELDSRRFHLTTIAFEDDHVRSLELTALGYTATGLTWDQLVGRPDWVASRLRALLAQTPGPRTCS
jgi:very-short-patch-repair endonuclease